MAHEDSRSVRYRLLSPAGRQMAQLFDTAQEAASAATAWWPGVPQRSDDNGADGWDIEVVRD